MCLAENATLNTRAHIAHFKDYFTTSATKEFKPQADVALFKKVRSMFQKPLPTDTRIFDFQGNKVDYRHKMPQSLLGKSSPDLNDLGIKLSLADANDKRVLICFF